MVAHTGARSAVWLQRRRRLGGPYGFACDGPQTVTTSLEILIEADVVLDGLGKLTVDGGGQHRLFVVSMDATVELRRLTLTGGRASESGGAVVNRGTLTIEDSLVSGNSASMQGGGIANLGGMMTIRNSTVSGNDAPMGGDAIWNGNLDEMGALIAGHSLIDGACGGISLDSDGYNIESAGDSCGFDQPSDLVDVSAGALALGTLADNGGPTQTHALAPASIAVDAIPAEMCGVEEDQRGIARPQGSMCDIGSFELEP